MANAPAKPPPPNLVYPAPRNIPPPDGCKDYVDRPLSIRYVDTIDSSALIVNLASAAIVFWLMFLIIGPKAGEPLRVAIPGATVWTLAVLIRNRLWTRVDARKAKVYLDNIFRMINAYAKGFHFVPWFSTPEIDEIDFQKHEIITAEKKDGTEIRFESRDAYDLFADIKILFNRRDGIDALSKSLKFQLSEIKDWTLAIVIGRLSDLGGCNSYETLLYYKSDVAAWVANIFGGDKRISPFEDELGISVKNPILKDLDLTEESKKTFGTKAKIGIIKEGIDELKKSGLSAEEAAITAQAAEGVAQRVIHTYQGVPQGAKVVALGDTGIAIAAKGGK